ncbi:hypothetical protein H9L17_07760 [Thermomonas brevis]|uniref:Uncharacterized protein n=1 Tax=Thermomonas brevis TaxID=215691 RepID=A0A7G9QXD0_9GAMM|nr:hypothetical protein [Thermomonas brevis]QNN48005.1 hypothetical protein H9L17_07760 [Thermomonas brevis]
MQLGADWIVACPHCAAPIVKSQGDSPYILLPTIIKLVRELWSDGRTSFGLGRGCSDNPAKCIKCKNYFWWNEAEDVCHYVHQDRELESEHTSIPEILTAFARHPDKPTEKEYYQLISDGFAKTRSQQLSLRTAAWRRSNDAFRRHTDSDAATISMTSLERQENLEALAELAGSGLHDENNDIRDHYLIMKAEILRELGKFSSALSLLDQIDYSSLRADIAQQLRRSCWDSDSIVLQLDMISIKNNRPKNRFGLNRPPTNSTLSEQNHSDMS